MLASVHSREENDFIMVNMVKMGDISDAWLGLTSMYQAPLEFEWLDGSPFDFQKWNGGEPNNAEDMESCVTMYMDAGTSFLYYLRGRLFPKVKVTSTMLTVESYSIAKSDFVSGSVFGGELNPNTMLCRLLERRSLRRAPRFRVQEAQRWRIHDQSVDRDSSRPLL